MLLDKRLIFVTGKGGVGKSTVATALGRLAARRGLRTVVAELARQQRVPRTFGIPAAQPFVEHELAPGLFSISIDPQDAMEEYFRVKAGTIGQTLGSSRVFATFAMATPGMREMLSIGKVWELAQLQRRTRGGAPYDLVVVDAPASGHGVGILRTPTTFAGIARVGPIAHQARTIAATIADQEFTGVIAVATAEEMPVNETFTLEAALHELGLELDAVVVNGMLPRRFKAAELAAAHAAIASAADPVAQAALYAARFEHTRARTQHRQRERLRVGVQAPLVDLPFLPAPEIALPELDALADALGRRLAHRPAGRR
jgi:anion-transporting  ArsA/GET3 family ATPase